MTFDDGPHPDYTPAVLDVLVTHGAKATFFVTGQRAMVHPELAARIVGGVVPGSVVVLHDGLAKSNRGGQSVEALDMALGRLGGAGLRFEALYEPTVNHKEVLV